jgi:predicted PurR-regulated permease PerM
MSDSKTINISTSTIVKVIFIILGLVFLYLILNVIVLFIFALIIASAIAPAVGFFEKIKIPRVIGALIVYILVIAIAAFLISLIVPTVASNIKDLASNLPSYIESLSAKFKSLQNVSSKYGVILDKLQEYLNGAGETLRNFGSNIFPAIIGFFGGIFSVILVLVMSFYISVQKKGVQRVLTSIIPINYRDYILDLWERAQKKLGRWLQGQLFLSILVGTIVYTGLYLLNIKYALLLGILSGIMEIFPYIGPVLAGVPAVILAFLQAPILGLWVLILYLVVHQIEGYLITPFVMGRVVGLNPIVIILALLIGGKLGGLLGMVLAVPLAAVFAELLRDMIKKRKQTEQQ